MGVVSFTPRPLYPGERAPGAHFIGASEVVWTRRRREKFLAPAGNGIPVGPARSLVTILTELFRLPDEKV